MHGTPPTAISYDDVKAALVSVGLDTTDLREVVIERDQITARYIRRDNDGKAWVAGLSVAEVTYEIGVTR